MAKKQKIGYQPVDNSYTKDIDAWFIILMLAVFFPIGLWLMWTRTSWKKWIKILVSALVAVLFLARLIVPAVTESAGSAPGGETTAIEETLAE